MKLPSRIELKVSSELGLGLKTELRQFVHEKRANSKYRRNDAKIEENLVIFIQGSCLES